MFDGFYTCELVESTLYQRHVDSTVEQAVEPTSGLTVLAVMGHSWHWFARRQTQTGEDENVSGLTEKSKVVS